MGERDLAAKLRDLGIEGRVYFNDLGQVASIHLGKVYVCNPDLLVEDIHGHLTYVDGATLDPRWEYYGLPRAFDMKPDTTPSAIIGLAGGKLFVINRTNGTTDLEPRRVDVVPSGAPVATDSTIYVPSFPTPSGNKTVYAINLASGYQGWGWRTSTDIIGGMAKGGPGAGDTFYFVTSDGVVYGFPTYPATERNAEPAWTANVHGAVSNDLTIEGDDLAVVTNDGRLVMLDRITGSTRWEAYPNAGEQAVGSAQFSKSHAFYDIAGELRAFERAGGAKAWGVRGARQFVAERGNRMLFSDGAGRLISVDKKTGKVLGRASAHGWRFPARTDPDSTVYAVSNDGQLVAVEFGF